MNYIDNFQQVKQKLDFFIDNKDIPNLLFHGSYNTNKEEIVFDFLKNIYNGVPDYKRNFVMYVNCAFGTGIKFIRDNIKFFARTHNYPKCDFNFKTIVISNAEYLTPDAQSALRRSIEEFSKTTRFIFITNDKQKILMPILSRFCEIFVYKSETTTTTFVNPSSKISKIVNKLNITNIFDTIDEMENNAISGLELINYLITIIDDHKQKLIFKGLMHHYKGIIHNEKLFLYCILDNYLNRSRLDIKNKPFV